MSRRVITGERVDKRALAVWVAILVLTGTYLRTRDADAIPTTDWLVILQVLTGGLGIVIGTLMIRKHGTGFGGKAALACVVAAGSSAVFSEYTEVVAGYWVVLAGGYLLTIGLVRQSKRQEDLDLIEYACFLTLFAILLKDTVIGFAYPDPDAPEGELFRLGMGLTHANTMSILASIAFWMSFGRDHPRQRLLLWPARFLFIAVIVLSRTRIAMIGLVVAGIIRSAIRHTGGERARAYPLLVAIPCAFMTVIVLSVLAASWQIPAVASVAEAFNRGEDTQMVMSITGRTEIWTYALEKISDAPWPQFLFGHGFGISRFVLNDGYRATEYYAAHAHNGLLEIVLSMGLLGAIPFIVCVLYSLTWITRFANLQETFSMAFSLHAIAIVFIILLASVTEPFLGGKLGPVAMIFVFYYTALDQRECIAG